MTMALEQRRSRLARQRTKEILYQALYRTIGIGSPIIIGWRFFQWHNFTELSGIDECILGGATAVGALWTFVLFCFLFDRDLIDGFGTWVQRYTKLHLAAVWILSLALISSAGVITVQAMPNRLAVDPNAVLLMDDGRVIPASSSVVVPRNRITDVQVDLERETGENITIPTAAGSITLRVGFLFRSRQGEDLNQLIRGKESELGLGKDVDDRKIAQEKFFGQRVAEYLDPYARQIVS